MSAKGKGKAAVDGDDAMEVNEVVASAPVDVDGVGGFGFCPFVPNDANAAVWQAMVEGAAETSGIEAPAPEGAAFAKASSTPSRSKKVVGPVTRQSVRIAVRLSAADRDDEPQLQASAFSRPEARNAKRRGPVSEDEGEGKQAHPQPNKRVCPIPPAHSPADVLLAGFPEKPPASKPVSKAWNMEALLEPSWDQPPTRDQLDRSNIVVPKNGAAPAKAKARPKGPSSRWATGPEATHIYHFRADSLVYDALEGEVRRVPQQYGFLYRAQVWYLGV